MFSTLFWVHSHLVHPVAHLVAHSISSVAHSVAHLISSVATTNDVHYIILSTFSFSTFSSSFSSSFDIFSSDYRIDYNWCSVEPLAFRSSRVWFRVFGASFNLECHLILIIIDCDSTFKKWHYNSCSVEPLALSRVSLRVFGAYSKTLNDTLDNQDCLECHFFWQCVAVCCSVSRVSFFLTVCCSVLQCV